MNANPGPVENETKSVKLSTVKTSATVQKLKDEKTHLNLK